VATKIKRQQVLTASIFIVDGFILTSTQNYKKTMGLELHGLELMI
jgi:hypothetical protein